MLNKKKLMLHGMEDVKAFVAAAQKCEFDIDIYYNRVVIDAKSILGILSMDLTKVLTVDYDGFNEEFENFLAMHEPGIKAIA